MIELAETLLRKLRERLHLRQARAVLATAPLVPQDDGVILFSMIGTRVVLPYLVAIKSLHQHLQRGRCVILDDGSLTSEDKAVLAGHLGNPEIHHIDDIDVGPCPRRSVWERLLLLLELRQQAYTLQVDSDTVTLGPVPEVLAAIEQGRNFTLKGEASARWLTVEEFKLTTPGLDPLSPTTHVQGAAEELLPQALARLPQPAHYVRGCAGFAGFAKGGAGREMAEQFSRDVEAIVGRESWKRWGSEQVTSNVIVANEGEPVLLPYDRYLNFWNEPLPAGTAFTHFIGTFRFHRGAYAAATRKAIAALRR
ncbi:MAG: hypothetical protein P0Y56_13375 [Candidatus Andeanibacterium colombiense]|uniref:Uncharacterized protein n=1 Tax=Candidatus Andeanibacterium colombiense TaxID=3121345 RepID=A0AAJ5X7K2_9SPHN|nr:MAG: hypothetical protein P0Y56_13375 [Sphingomonadaceae bacterium]